MAEFESQCRSRMILCSMVFSLLCHWRILRPSRGKLQAEELTRHPDVIVDLNGFPGDKPPDINQFYATVTDVLATAGIEWCLAGDQAWEYYKAPFVVSVSSICLEHPLANYSHLNCRSRKS
jgi:hypothetical protein